MVSQDKNIQPPQSESYSKTCASTVLVESETIEKK